MPEQEFYSDSDAEEILKEAVRNSNNFDGLSRDQLMKSAAELGLSPEQVAAAEKRLAEKQIATTKELSIEQQLSAFKATRKAKMLKDIPSYLGTSVLLYFIHLATSSSFSLGWSKWPIFVLTGLLIWHLLEYLFHSYTPEDPEFKRWQRRQETRNKTKKATEEFKKEDK